MTTVTDQPSLAGLPRFCGSGFITDEDASTAPWRAGAWQVSTNGFIAVAIRVPLDGQPDTLPTRFAKIQSFLLEAQIKTPVSGTYAALVAMAGTPQSATGEECEDCGGEGYTDDDMVPCEHCARLTRIQCAECDGSGTVSVEPPIRARRICGLPVNVNYLAYALACVPPCERVAIGLLSQSNLGIFADDWCIVIAALADWSPAARAADVWEVQ